MSWYSRSEIIRSKSEPSGINQPCHLLYMNTFYNNSRMCRTNTDVWYVWVKSVLPPERSSNGSVSVSSSSDDSNKEQRKLVHRQYTYMFVHIRGKLKIKGRSFPRTPVRAPVCEGDAPLLSSGGSETLNSCFIFPTKISSLFSFQFFWNALKNNFCLVLFIILSHLFTLVCLYFIFLLD